ncbi:MAG: sulfurtransferase [Candidatus Krumholzibacteriia bacterium]
MHDLVDTAWLAANLGDERLVVADIRWQHGQPDFGRDAFETARIPGAVRLSLDADLSDLRDPSRGRHPLPDPRRLVAALARAGIGEGTHVVAYDDAAGALAGRLWWLLRWLGLRGIGVVLDGGLAKWIAEDRPLESGPAPASAPHPRPLAPRVRDELVASRDEVARAAALGLVLLDARAPERYRGEVEPIDARAGHIPGALNAPFAANLTDDAAPVYRTPEELRAAFARLGLGPDDGPRVVCYCGSGVTACHDLLALEMAGVRGARLYPGSWSEWVAATGAA